MFVYVFDEGTRDMLMEKGYDIVSSNPKRHVYAFASDADIETINLLHGHRYVFSDTLTFDGV